MSVYPLYWRGESMIQIVKGLYLGNRDAARDLEGLQAAGITHIVNCTAELSNYHEDVFEYLHLKMADPDPAFRDHIVPTCQFIDQGREAGGVLVHCFAAISRSPSVILGYLCHLGHRFEEAARHLGELVWTDPDFLFLEQLADHLQLELAEDELRAVSHLLQGKGE